MHHADRYDEHHAELASGEGMPEAREPHAPQDDVAATPPPDAGTAADAARPSA